MGTRPLIFGASWLSKSSTIFTLEVKDTVLGDVDPLIGVLLGEEEEDDEDGKTPLLKRGGEDDQRDGGEEQRWPEFWG